MCWVHVGQADQMAHKIFGHSKFNMQMFIHTICKIMGDMILIYMVRESRKQLSNLHPINLLLWQCCIIVNNQLLHQSRIILISCFVTKLMLCKLNKISTLYVHLPCILEKTGSSDIWVKCHLRVNIWWSLNLFGLQVEEVCACSFLLPRKTK